MQDAAYNSLPLDPVTTICDCSNSQDPSDQNTKTADTLDKVNEVPEHYGTAWDDEEKPYKKENRLQLPSCLCKKGLIPGVGEGRFPYPLEKPVLQKTWAVGWSWISFEDLLAVPWHRSLLFWDPFTVQHIRM